LNAAKGSTAFAAGDSARDANGNDRKLATRQMAFTRSIRIDVERRSTRDVFHRAFTKRNQHRISKCGVN